jgi:hypothetical protein
VALENTAVLQYSRNTAAQDSLLQNRTTTDCKCCLRKSRESGVNKHYLLKGSHVAGAYKYDISSLEVFTTPRLCIGKQYCKQRWMSAE